MAVIVVRSLAATRSQSLLKDAAIGTPTSSGIFSYPWIRAISSSRSASRAKSLRQVGGVTVRDTSSLAVSVLPSASRMRLTSSRSIEIPRILSTCDSRMITGSGDQVVAPASSQPSSSVPPQCSSTSSHARLAAHSMPSGSSARSKRYEAGLWRLRARDVARVAIEEKAADSIRTSTVESLTSLSAPPITPAMATGRLASDITHMSGVSW